MQMSKAEKSAQEDRRLLMQTRYEDPIPGVEEALGSIDTCSITEGCHDVDLCSREREESRFDGCQLNLSISISSQ